MFVSMTWRRAYWKTRLLAVKSAFKRSRDRRVADGPKNPCERKADESQGHDSRMPRVIRTK